MNLPNRLTPFRVSICGLDEIAAFVDEDVSHVVSILDPDYPEPSDFARFPDHDRVTFRFDDIITDVPTMQAPTVEDVRRILAVGETVAGDSARHLLVHCHAGVSRSTAAVAVLLSQANPGREGEIFDHIYTIRQKSWPNSLMVRLGDEILGRDGRLVEALAAHHARVARTYPDLAAMLRAGARAHEVPDLL